MLTENQHNHTGTTLARGQFFTEKVIRRQTAKRVILNMSFREFTSVSILAIVFKASVKHITSFPISLFLWFQRQVLLIKTLAVVSIITNLRQGSTSFLKPIVRNSSLPLSLYPPLIFFCWQLFVYSINTFIFIEVNLVDNII